MSDAVAERPRWRPREVLPHAVALLGALVVGFPLYWMVLSALKPTVELNSGDALPYTLSPTLDAFVRGCCRSTTSAAT